MVWRVIVAIVAIFVLWSVIDMVLHGAVLGTSYEQTASLWRPMEQMKMWLIYVVTLVGAACFVGIYAWLVQPKSLGAALLLGLLFGVASGFSMAFGTYAVMPIPLPMALAWLVGWLVESLGAGVVVALIVKPRKA